MIRGSSGRKGQAACTCELLYSARRVYDIVESTGKCKIFCLLDLPHEDNECEKVKYAQAIMRLKKAYEKFSGKTFDKEAFLNSFTENETEMKPYIGLMADACNGYS